MTITLMIVILTCVVTFYAWSNPELNASWIMNPYRAYHHKEYWRLLTSGFLHATDQPRGYMHVGFNMYALYLFGSQIEKIFIYLFEKEWGIVLYILMYVLGIILSSLPSLIKHRDNPGYNALGASGGVSTVVFSFIMFVPTYGIGMMFIPIYIPGFILGLIYLIYSYYMSKKGGRKVGHDAHFFGALFGIIFTLAAYPNVLDEFFINGPYGLANWDFSLFQ